MQSKPSTLQGVFSAYSKGKPDLESKMYVQIYKDAKIIDKTFSTNDADINFSKVKSGKVKTITFAEFEKTIELCAARKKTTKDKIVEKILAGPCQPVLHGTKADFVKFHDDKSTYTGVYARGGPTTVDAGRGGQVSDISQICDRTKADVRGVKK